MKGRLKRFVPSPEAVRSNRWLRWMGPALHQPRLWHVGRRAIALGVAIGIFFGLLVPIAQIPLSATLAVVLRANVPAAIASTLVTNPVTFGPIYYLAYRLGSLIVDDTPASEAEAIQAVEEATKAIESANTIEPIAELTRGQRVQNMIQRITSVGRPLLVGLVILAVVCGLLAYFLVSGIWALRTRLTRRRRIQSRTLRTPALPDASDPIPPTADPSQPSASGSNPSPESPCNASKSPPDLR